MKKIATMVAVVAALAAAPYVAKADVCDGSGGGPVLGNGAKGCSYIFTFGTGGAISTAVGDLNGAPYDGVEDTLFGVVNNSGNPLPSISLSSSIDILAFDGDGIDGYVGITDANDSTGYGAGDSTFTIVDSYNGSVNFDTPIPNGGVGYFSLEEALTLDQAGQVVGAPEPISMALLGVGVVGLGVVRRRRAA